MAVDLKIMNISSNEKSVLLKTITMKEVKELCKTNYLKGYSQLKQDALVKFAAKT